MAQDEVLRQTEMQATLLRVVTAHASPCGASSLGGDGNARAKRINRTAAPTSCQRSERRA